MVYKTWHNLALTASLTSWRAPASLLLPEPAKQPLWILALAPPSSIHNALPPDFPVYCGHFPSMFYKVHRLCSVFPFPTHPSLLLKFPLPPWSFLDHLRKNTHHCLFGSHNPWSITLKEPEHFISASIQHSLSPVPEGRNKVFSTCQCPADTTFLECKLGWNAKITPFLFHSALNHGSLE